MSDVAAVLFDMDGTLVDSDAAVENAWRRWAALHRLPAEQVLRVAHGRWASVTIRELLPELDEETVAAQARELNGWEADEVASTTAAPGAHELLAALDIPWAIVTGADNGLAAARLQAAGIAPKLLVTADDVRAGKPDPEGFLLAARRLGVDPRKCLVVEDALPGIEAGRRAGATVAALRGYQADISIGDLRDLISHLRPGS
ncbi:HAD-IA family hydrolase [Fodinicola acaciae]|uniref:HAD-IA family hydrolase n=1 Tax=Fodinicola acaciae TaxID=2681555 RepID=UPI0013D31C68|nr:HAD-IA family hydrolase [Fodinicola acaciae]